MNKKKKFVIKSKHLLVLLAIFCVSGIFLSTANYISIQPLREGASAVITPFQKGINSVGTWICDRYGSLQGKQKLIDENKALKAEIAELTEKNSQLVLDMEELDRLRKLYDLDQSYPEYDKIAAKVIGKEPGNWYNSFVINKGSADGIQTDMNVIADGGLVGIVTEVTEHSANVRAIIDDTSSVSAMTASTSDSCVVQGDLVLMSVGKLSFSQMNTTNAVSEGEMLVTSNISDKYLPGILIGYVTDVTEDSNHLTKTGYLIPVVDFTHLQEVFVILELK